MTVYVSAEHEKADEKSLPARFEPLLVKWAMISSHVTAGLIS